MNSFFCLFLLFLSATFGSEKINIAFNNDRGADVVIQTPLVQDDSSVLLMNEPTTGDKVEDLSFGDLISNYIGGPVVNPKQSRESFPKKNLFDKSKANLLLSIDGVGKDSSQSLENLKKKATKELPLFKTSYPQDNLATMTTMLTGETPSVHGIMGSTWYKPGKGMMEAYRAKALPKVDSVVDRAHEAYEGESLIFSFSGDYQFASAGGIHQYSHAENPSSNTFGFYWNGVKQRFQSIYNPEEKSVFTLEKQQIISSFEKKISSESLSLEENSLVVRVGDQLIVLNLQQRENFALIAEIEFILNLLEQLTTQKSASVSDNYPDLFFITISSLKGIQQKYGEHSKEVTAALSILDVYLTKIINEFEKIYNGKISTEVVLFGKPTFFELQANTELKKQVYNSLKKHIVDKTAFDSTFPVVHLTKPLEDAGESLRKDLKEHNLQVHTFHRIQEALTEENYSDAAQYQIIIWMSVFLVLAIFGAIWATCTMDIGADSIIYRLTTVNLKKNL